MNGLPVSVLTNINGDDKLIDCESYDLIKNRRITINGEINDIVFDKVKGLLEWLDNQSNDDITIVINSPGGNVTSGLAIYDWIKGNIKSDIATVAVGLAASMGAFLLAAAGTKGKRYATENTEILIHQPSGGATGQATDIILAAERIQYKKKCLTKILAEASGNSLEKVMNDCERDKSMSAKEALEYGLIDHIGFPIKEKGEDNYDY